MLDRFKLEKLKVTAYEDAKRKTPLGGGSAIPGAAAIGLGAGEGEFEAMFNPGSFKQSFAFEWGGRRALNTSGEQLCYKRSRPQQLSLTLLLDGTGVLDDMDLLGLLAEPVEEKVQQFLKVAFTYNGTIHEPNYLRVEWGSLSSEREGASGFDCRLSKVDVRYTTFGRDGKPLRAELDVTFIGEKETEIRLKEEGKSSPDLTHRRLVRSGDTLPLLTREIYGSAQHHLAVARYNGLDDIRLLEPGRTLLFPPLATLTAEGG